MSAADLVFTLHYAIHTGLNESNPIARVMIAHHSPLALGVWKGATVALGVGILVRVRTRVSAECGAWLVFVVFAGLMVHWTRFVEVHGSLALDPAVVAEIGDPTWVRMGAGQSTPHAAPGRGLLFGPIGGPVTGAVRTP